MNTVFQYLELTPCRFPRLTHSSLITQSEANPYNVNLYLHRLTSADSPRIQPPSGYTAPQVAHLHTPPINKVTTRTTSGIQPPKEVIVPHAR